MGGAGALCAGQMCVEQLCRPFTLHAEIVVLQEKIKSFSRQIKA
jgi:hypothetical protein